MGPSTGSVLLAGGGRLGPEIYRRFVELAGGADARIVVIPTASPGDDFDADWAGLEPFRTAGAASVEVLHTRNPTVADSESFVKPLWNATGVWLEGGRPWRLMDAYGDTWVEAELRLVVARGGVVGGTSAGATALASFLIRSAPEDNDILMTPEYESGFGLLQDVAVDQHLLARGRQTDLLEVLRYHPELLGIGLDEGTAVVVIGDRAEVLGRSRVAFYDRGDGLHLFRWLEPGEVFDLGERRKAEEAPPEYGPEYD